MIHGYKLAEDYFKDGNGAMTKIVDIGDVVECNYGMGPIIITRNDLTQLLLGKVLWIDINDGEYAAVLKIKED